MTQPHYKLYINGDWVGGSDSQTMDSITKLFDLAGFPKGVVSVITGDAKNCAVPLTSDPDMDRIAFTGGPETASHVIGNSAHNYAVTTLELGGKSPLIVFEDADIESAVNGLIAGNFGASGQSCVAGSRGIIHKSLMLTIIERIKKRAEDIIVGDPLDAKTHIGPLCTPCLLYTSPSPRDRTRSRMPSSA